MNLLKQYRQEQGLTQKQLAEEINKQLGISFFAPDISRMETGKVGIPENVKSYIDSKIIEKPFANPSDERKDGEWVNTPPAQKKSLKTEIPKNWSAKNLTQSQRILGYIDEQGSITTKEAFDILGIARLASRIHDLCEEGYEFDRETETVPNRFGKAATYTRYSFRKEDHEQTDMDRQRNMV